jgi:phytoene synthase
MGRIMAMHAGVVDAAGRLERMRCLPRRRLPASGSAIPPSMRCASSRPRREPAAPLCRDVIEGFALDAAEWRPAHEDDLYRYCYHVAGAVG